MFELFQGLCKVLVDSVRYQSQFSQRTDLTGVALEPFFCCLFCFFVSFFPLGDLSIGKIAPEIQKKKKEKLVFCVWVVVRVTKVLTKGNSTP